MKYVYGCTDHPATREEVIHSMKDDPFVPCPECGKPMHRIPQPVRFYNNPVDVLNERIDREFAEYKARKAKQVRA